MVIMTRMPKSKMTKPSKLRRRARDRKGDLTGEVLIAAIQASPYRDIEIEPRRPRMPVRDVTL
jgi:hypothetical protein